MAESYEQLRALSDDEIRERYNESAKHTSLGVVFYREELHRREIDRQTRTLVRLTWCIALLTLANAVFVLVAVFR